MISAGGDVSLLWIILRQRTPVNLLFPSPHSCLFLVSAFPSLSSSPFLPLPLNFVLISKSRYKERPPHIPRREDIRCFATDNSFLMIKKSGGASSPNGCQITVIKIAAYLQSVELFVRLQFFQVGALPLFSRRSSVPRCLSSF